MALVPALVQTIKRFLPRHGRLGIPDFLKQLEANFGQLHFESHREDKPSYMPHIPATLHDDLHSVGRYIGNHLIYA